MKKTVFTIIITGVVTIQGYGQKVCDISNQFEDFITLEKSTFNEKEFLFKRVTKTDNNSCFSELINKNILFVDYLLTNFSSNSNYQDLLNITDTLQLKEKYFTDIKKDSLFNNVMTDLVNKTINKNTPKDTISSDQLLNIAVKYFSIKGINSDGHYEGKVCAGINDIKKTEKQRKPFIEAFCFSSILKHYQSEEYSMIHEFVIAIKELYEVNLGIDNEEKLLRAQGAMFFLMKNNENLKKMLMNEYEINKDYLPFILREN